MNLWYKCALWWTAFFVACFVAFVIFGVPYGPRWGLVAAVPYPVIWVGMGFWTRNLIK